MHWNHRIVRSTRGVDGPILQFAEVYYDDTNNELMSWSDPFMVGDTVDDLRELVQRLQRASLLPVIDETEFPKPKEQS